MHLLLRSLAVGMLVSCTEKVTVIDPVEGGAASGAGGSPPAVSSADLQAACDAVCARADCELWRGFCATQCASVIEERCEAESLALLQCLANAPAGSCKLGLDDCSTLPLGDCADGEGGSKGCDQASCVVEVGTCSCSGVCQGDVLSQDCVEQPDGTAICTCYAGGKVVKTCESPETACYLAACCGS